MTRICSTLAVLAIAGASAGSLAVPNATATTYVVNPSGTGNFATIQAAIDAATNGDVIELASGTFTGDGNRDLTYHGKSITVKAQAASVSACVIDCGGSAGSSHRGFLFDSGETASAVLEGITITHGYVSGYPYGRGGGIYCHDSSPTIRRCAITQSSADAGGGGLCCANLASPSLIECTISENHGGNGGGIGCWGSGNGVNGASPTFTDCAILLNTADGAGGGIYQTQAGSAQFLRCKFSGNSAGYGGAGSFHLAGTAPVFTSCTFRDNSVTISGGTIRSGDSASPSFDRCVLSLASYGSAVDCVDAGSVPTFECCDIYGNAGGDWTGCIASQASANQNLSVNPGFCVSGTTDFTIQDLSPCAAANNPCGLIGASGVGCVDNPTIHMTWGRLKASFRN
jgi:hypothetical protein